MVFVFFDAQLNAIECITPGYNTEQFANCQQAAINRTHMNVQCNDKLLPCLLSRRQNQTINFCHRKFVVGGG
jgi:coproporphyrinogen III oxidase-like Fe-S oxidoreductase